MEEEYFGIDRRRSKRVRVSLSLIYKVDEPLTIRLLTANKEIKANLINLSDSGMAILTDYNIAVDTTMIVRFTLFKVEKDDVGFYGPVELKGVVRYSNKEGELCRLGISFLKINDQDKKEIRDFASLVASQLDKRQE